MGFIDDIKDNIVAIDTSPLIYYIEENDRYTGVLEDLFLAVSTEMTSLITSPITVMEVLVKPMKDGNERLTEEYLRIFHDSNDIEILPLDIEIAKKSAELRSRYGLRVPDAIQVSTAIIGNASFFLTNDRRLKKVNEIKVLILDELLD